MATTLESGASGSSSNSKQRSVCSEFEDVQSKCHKVTSILAASQCELRAPQGNICLRNQLETWRKHFVLALTIALFFMSNIGRTFAQSDLGKHQNSTIPYPDNVFIEKFINMFGENDTLTVEGLDGLLSLLRSSKFSDRTIHSGDRHLEPTSVNPSAADNDLGIISELEERCNRSSSQWKKSTICLTNQCLNSLDLLSIYNLSATGTLTKEDLYKLSSALVYQSQNDLCQSRPAKGQYHSHKPASSATWGYGFLFVSIINVCSLGGVIVLPFMKTTIYKQVLMFLVALAVGSLAGSGLLFLIPEAFNLVTDEDHTDYVWKATTIMGGIYLFFLVERFLKLIMEVKKRGNLNKANIDLNGSENSETEKEDWAICSVKARTPHCVSENAHLKDLDPNLRVTTAGVCSTRSGTISRESSVAQDLVNGIDMPELANGNGSTTRMIKPAHDSAHDRKQHALMRQQSEIATVAWMVIFGDGLHNFIDGLSIGAAFTESILSGVSVSVAVICEELPHELGDFAILLNSGMSLKKALMYNFLSACMCYLGMIAGILLGQNTAAHDWIFALAGGMFLYISLVDMLPEMNSAAEEEEKKKRTICSRRVFLLQNSGLLIGYSLLLTMALYGHEIDFE